MKISEFLSEYFQFLVVKFSIYLIRCVFVMLVRNVALPGLFSYVFVLFVLPLGIIGRLCSVIVALLQHFLSIIFFQNICRDVNNIWVVPSVKVSSRKSVFDMRKVCGFRSPCACAKL